MTQRQLVFGLCVLLTVLSLAGIGAYVSISRHQQQIAINAQTAVEKTRIEQENKLHRTQERMKVVPWYKPAK